MRALFIFLTGFLLQRGNAQVVFCPAGAEWHYAYKYLRVPPYQGKVFNQQVKYARDSVIGSETLKVLKHDRFYIECDLVSPVKYISRLTLIKQKGDTVFFRNNNTNNAWQILYNFNCTVGQSWQTTVIEDATHVATYTVEVSAVTSTVINGFALKKLITTYRGPEPTIRSVAITERIGANAYLFNFYNSTYAACDYDMFYSPLCYQDNANFGSYRFTSLDCNYYEPIEFTALKEHGIGTADPLNICPNPITNETNFEIVRNEHIIGELDIQIVDVLGREKLIAKIDRNERKLMIDANVLNPGVYFLSAFNGTKFLGTRKILRE